MLGGTSVGVSLSLAGSIIPAHQRFATGTLLALVVAVAAIAAPKLVPQLNRETKQSMLAFGPLRWATANGFLLGTGFASRIGYWIFYVFAAGCLVLPAGAAAFAGACYGGTRLGVAAGMAAWLHQHPDEMGRLSQSLLRARPTTDRYAGIAAAVGGVILAVAIGV